MSARSSSGLQPVATDVRRLISFRWCRQVSLLTSAATSRKNSNVAGIMKLGFKRKRLTNPSGGRPGGRASLGDGRDIQPPGPERAAFT